MSTRIAINGLGRIGRAFVRAAQQSPDITIVAVNDLGSAEQLAYLLQHDSVYGQAPFTVAAEGDTLMVAGKPITHLSEPDPSKLPWKDLAVDVVIEATGLFASYEKAGAHITAGAKRVVITAPVKDEPGAVAGATVLVGVNEDAFKTSIITSNASCTTNAASPIIQILNDALGIEKAVLSTTHAYTASQNLVDGPVKKAKGKEDFRDGRAGADNIVPSSTGAAIAVTKAIPALSGNFDGISLRVPVVAGSIADITFVAKRATTVEEVNTLLTNAANEDRWKPVFSVTNEPLVSTDVLGSPFASIADLGLTRVVGGNLVKVLAWYDNEMGYAHALVAHVSRVGACL